MNDTIESLRERNAELEAELIRAATAQGKAEAALAHIDKKCSELTEAAAFAQREQRKAEAACREMRSYLQSIEWRSNDDCQPECIACGSLKFYGHSPTCKLQHALSLDAGKGFVSPEEHAKAIECSRKTLVALSNENLKLDNKLSAAVEGLERIDLIECVLPNMLKEIARETLAKIMEAQ